MMIRIASFLGLLVTLAIVGRVGVALENGLARTPPMGWLAWVRFTCTTDCKDFPNDCINDKLFKTMADRLVSGGYKDRGYEYVNIDDCWSTKERENGLLVPDHERFPAGMGQLSKYVQSKGLKLGIYGDCGIKTCAGYPAQLKIDSSSEENYFETDAKTFAEWEIDSFKFDGCFIDPLKAESICPAMSLGAIKATNRSMLVTCEWPLYLAREGNTAPDFKVAQEACNLWRYYTDVDDSWVSILAIVDYTIKIQNTVAKYHGPGHWFDPDQLVIGNFGLSLEQSKSQMAIWSIWAAPLFMSNDLRNIEPEMETILLNKDVIKVNQDRMGVFGMMAAQTPNKMFQAFVKPVEEIRNGCPSFAIVYFSRSTLGNGQEVEFKVRDLLQNSAIKVAADRWAQIWASERHQYEPSFKADTCRYRLAKSMTKDPKDPLRGLVMKRQDAINEIEYHQVSYDVYDLFEDKHLFQVGLDSSLKLFVKPSGVRMVKLVESTQTKPIDVNGKPVD